MGIKIKGNKRIQFSKNIPEEVAVKGLNKIIIKLQGAARSFSPFDTGTLQKRHFVKFAKKGRLKSVLELQVHYGKFLYEGTRYIKRNPWIDRAFKRIGRLKKFFK